jgi:cell division protein FtsX
MLDHFAGAWLAEVALICLVLVMVGVAIGWFARGRF